MPPKRPPPTTAPAVSSSATSSAIDETEEPPVGPRPPQSSDYATAEEAFAAARDVYQRAQAPSDGADSAGRWLRAAQLFRIVQEKDPDSPLAVEAIVMGASSFRQAGAMAEAVKLYQRLVERYGGDDALDVLARDKSDPRAYSDRLRFLQLALEQLSQAHLLWLDYLAAAQIFEQTALNRHFEKPARIDAASNALLLYAQLGQRNRMDILRSTWVKLAPSEEHKRKIEWLFVQDDLSRYDPQKQKDPANRAARSAAIRSLETFCRVNRGKLGASGLVIRGSYHIASLQRSAGDEAGARSWCREATTAFDQHLASARAGGRDDMVLGSVEADMAAECHYRTLDAGLRRGFDYDSGYFRYAGEPREVFDKLRQDVETHAKDWYDKLQQVIDKYRSRRWAIAARARQGTLYDSCREGLLNTAPPRLKLYTDKEERLLGKLASLCAGKGQQAACEKEASFRAQRRAQWQQARDRELEPANRIMVRSYAEALLWAKAWQIPGIVRDHNAARRLSELTRELGDTRLREYTEGIRAPLSGEAFHYRDGMFTLRAVGLTPPFRLQVTLPPLPVVP